MFFHSWASIGRVMLASAIVFLLIVALLRVVGQQALAKTNSVSADEIRAAVRKAGLRSLSDARVVVLENDGDWSVVAKRDGESDESAFFGLPIPDRPGNSPDHDSDHAERVEPHRLP